jgi:tRNA(Ile)-lysidine synthase
LLLAHAAFPGRVEAATVDHQLRAESASEAALVAAICRERGISHAILTPSTPITGSLQSTARTVRYALLDDWRQARQIDWLMTAHHADDQAETLLMRLNRGSGVDGLSGIRARNGVILRPVLNARRADLFASLSALAPTVAAQAVADPSNHDAKYDRARMRSQLASAPDGLVDVAGFTQSAAALADAQSALHWMTERLAQNHLAQAEGAVTLDPTGLPPEMLRRLTVLALTRLDANANPRGASLSHALTLLNSRQSAMLGTIHIRPAKRGAARWTFTIAPPRRPNSA